MERVINKIYEVLKRRRYHRETPRNETDLKNRLRVFIEKDFPIQLVGFWGFGPKAHANWADHASCDFLDDLRGHVSVVYKPSLVFEFVFAEPHGFHNGVPEETIRSYVSEIKTLFDEREFRYRQLQPLWDKYKISFDRIEQLLKIKPDGWWDQVPNHEDILRNASRRNQRMAALEGAQRYVIMRDLEKTMWESEYPRAIFHAFSDSKLHGVLPNMPTLYLYAREGWSDTPWYVTGEENPDPHDSNQARPGPV